MLKITRYINGVKIDAQDLRDHTIENDIVLRAISAANRRLGDLP